MQDGGRTLVLHLRRGMKWSDGRPFTADDFVFWFEDIYRNKDLVPTPAAAMSINGKPGEVQKVDTYTVKFKFPDPYYLLPDVLAGSTAPRRPGPSGVERDGRLRAGPLPEAVPPEVRLQGRPRQEGQGRQVRQLGPPVPGQERLGAEPGAAGPHAVEDGHPHQHADVDTRAQPLQRLRGHGRQPASLHRPGGPDPGREPGGHQPPGDRRRVRLPGAAPRPRQGARLPREPGEGQLQALPRPRRLRRRHDHQVQSELRGRPGDRQVDEHRRLPARAVARHRPRPDQRDLLAGDGHAELGGARGQQQVQPGARVPEALVHPRRQEGQRDARQDRPRPRRTPRAIGCAPTARAGCASRS